MAATPHTQKMSGTVTQWLKPRQPLALWWQQNYPGLRQVSRELAARLLATRTVASTDELPNPTASPAIPVDTAGLRYYDYGLLGGAIDYRLRMEFTGQWGGDPDRTVFTRAWAGRRGSIAHASARLLADCAPALAASSPRARSLARSLPALAALLEASAVRLDGLAPWNWHGPYATGQHEEEWLS